MTRIYDFEEQLLFYLENVKQQIQSRPLNLGGISGPDGGSGGPPGGFVGKLPQNRISFDTTESENPAIPSSGESLVNNLNRIRYRIKQLETALSGGIALSVQQNNVPISNNVTTIDFVNGIVNSVGWNEVEVYIPRSGEPASYFYDLDDVPHFYTGNSGKILSVKSSEDGLEYIDRTFLNLLDTPSTYSGHHNKVLRVNSSANSVEFRELTLLDLFDTPDSYISGLYLKSTSSGFVLDASPNSFISLIDTFNDYSGRAGEFLVVNLNETGITTVPGLTVSTFTSLTDTPNSYIGHSRNIVVVNSSESGLEFIPVSGLQQVGVDIEENGVPFLDNVITLNFQGADVIYENPQKVTIVVSGNAGFIEVKSNGTTIVPAASTLNFVGFDVNQTNFSEVTITDISSSGVTSFLSLTDTPNSYIGNAGKVLVVNPSETGVAFASISGGVSGSINIWEPLAAPIFPHFLNDEFNDESLDSSWTIFDPNNVMVVSEDRNGLVLSISNDTAEQVVGIYKPISLTEQFSVWTKPIPYTYYGRGMKCGIFFSQNSPITEDSNLFVISNATDGIYRWIQVEVMFNYYNSDYALINHELPVLFSPSFMRLRVQINSNNAYIWLDDSLDGVYWSNISYKFNSGSGDYFTCPFVPQTVGLFIKKTDWGNVTMKARFPFFRVYENTDFFYIPEGRRV